MSYKITAMFFKLCSSSIYLFACVLAPSATWWLLCDTEVAKAKSLREKAKQRPSKSKEALQTSPPPVIYMSECYFKVRIKFSIRPCLAYPKFWESSERLGARVPGQAKQPFHAHSSTHDGHLSLPRWRRSTSLSTTLCNSFCVSPNPSVQYVLSMAHIIVGHPGFKLRG